MLRKVFPALVCCAPALASACAAGGPNTNGVVAPATPAPAATRSAGATTPAAAQPVTATVNEARVTAGGAGEAVFTLDVADGYHVNANPPSDKFYVGTEIIAAPQEGVTPGKAVYPPGESKKFQFSDDPLSVYEGRVVIRLPLSAGPGVAKGRRTVAARIRVQPCNDEACLPPREINANVPVVIE